MKHPKKDDISEQIPEFIGLVIDDQGPSGFYEELKKQEPRTSKGVKIGIFLIVWTSWVMIIRLGVVKCHCC